MCGFKFLRELLIQNESDKESFTLTLTKDDQKKKQNKKKPKKEKHNRRHLELFED